MRTRLAPIVVAVIFTTIALSVDAAPRDLSQILTGTFKYSTRTPSIIDVRELQTGCPRRDCIPSIDDPEYDSVLNTTYLKETDMLMLIQHNGITRAYPHNILNFREIVNEQFGDTPVVVSYCPLCASGVAFVAKVGGLASEFGVSGMLHNSDLVLYDRRTNNLWGQITGEAIVGDSAGQKLQRLPVRTISWASLQANYPNADVLKPDAQAKARLNDLAGGSPYGDYDTSSRIYFPVSAKDARAHVKELVYGIDLNGHAVAFTEKYLKKMGKVSKAINGQVIHITLNKDGSVTAMSEDTGKEVPVMRVFWFAWYTFHTNTELLI